MSILPSISKILEKVVHEQLYSYFTEHSYLSNNQHGFRKQHSTEHSVPEVLDRIISSLDSGNTPINIFLDLSKAFDTINHKILLAKLKHYGICGTFLNWFNSYLSNRKQFVEINNIRSDCSPVLFCIPQRSILGPLMFIIYVNDMHNSSDFFKFVQYADDTSLFNSMSAFQDSDTINKVYKWLCINKLSLNNYTEN